MYFFSAVIITTSGQFFKIPSQPLEEASPPTPPPNKILESNEINLKKGTKVILSDTIPYKQMLGVVGELHGGSDSPGEEYPVEGHQQAVSR